MALSCQIEPIYDGKLAQIFWVTDHVVSSCQIEPIYDGKLAQGSLITLVVLSLVRSNLSMMESWHSCNAGLPQRSFRGQIEPIYDGKLALILLMFCQCLSRSQIEPIYDGKLAQNVSKDNQAGQPVRSNLSMMESWHSHYQQPLPQEFPVRSNLSMMESWHPS